MPKIWGNSRKVLLARIRFELDETTTTTKKQRKRWIELEKDDFPEGSG